jgi:hypothetical protein
MEWKIIIELQHFISFVTANESKQKTLKKKQNKTKKKKATHSKT